MDENYYTEDQLESMAQRQEYEAWLDSLETDADPWLPYDGYIYTIPGLPPTPRTAA